MIPVSRPKPLLEEVALEARMEWAIRVFTERMASLLGRGDNPSVDYTLS